MRRIAGMAVGMGLLLGCTEYDLTARKNVDVFNQNPADKVDILLVVDNSCSMEPYQLKLGANFTTFLKYFLEADVDYHIGITTTDVERTGAGSIIGGVITPATENAEGVFANNVAVGTQGSPFEMGLEAASYALAEPLLSGPNVGFLREEASLSVIFVSDEEDFSPHGVNDYINELRNVKGQRDRDIFNSSALTVIDPANCQGQTYVPIAAGSRYIDIANQTGGVVGDLCGTDFEPIVTELSLNASRLRDTFWLSDKPNLATLQVDVDSRTIGCDAGEWWYDEIMNDEVGTIQPAIVFDRLQMPEPSSIVTVQYDPGTGGVAEFCSGSSANSDTGGAP